MMGKGCRPKGHDPSPFKGFAVDCSPRPFQGLETGFEGLVVGAFESGPGDFCLGLVVEEDKAKSSPRSSSLQESGEIEEEEAREGDEIENIQTKIVPHFGSKSECKEVE